MDVLFHVELTPQIYFRSGNRILHYRSACLREQFGKTIDKIQLLEYLDSNEHADADEVASVMEMSYSASAMALLRLVRQDLASRYQDLDTQLYVYELTPKGEARLNYLRDEFIYEE